MSEQDEVARRGQIKRLANDKLALLIWCLQQIQSGKLTKAQIMEAFEYGKRPAAAPSTSSGCDLAEFEAVASEAWEGWEE